MSENESAGEKTEQPTEKRLRDAREQGNLPRSRELGTAAVFGAGVLAVMAMSGSIGRGASAWMKQALSPEQSLRQNPKELFGHFGDLLLQFMLVIAPLVLVCLLASFVAPLVMGGLRWSQKALLPDINRMNPMSGLKRLYGPEAIAEFTKSLLRVAFVGVAAGLVVWTGFDTLRGLIHHPGDRHHRRARLHPAPAAGHRRRDAGAGRHRCAVPALELDAQAEDDPRRAAPGNEGERGQPRGEGPHPPAAAADGQPPDDGGGTHRRRGGGQPDALRGGPEVRGWDHECSHRGRPGRGRNRPAHP